MPDEMLEDAAAYEEAPEELRALVAAGVAPASLVAHLSILLGARLPVVVAGPAESAVRDHVAAALGTTLRHQSAEERLVSSLDAEDLAALLSMLRKPSSRAIGEELQRFGVALFLGERAPHGWLISAHLLRTSEGAPSSRSAAVATLLATWNEERDQWDDFAWAAIPDLAARCGVTHEAYARLLADREALLAPREERGEATER